MDGGATSAVTDLEKTAVRPFGRTQFLTAKYAKYAKVK